MKNFQELFNSISSLRVGVVGDVMLDCYMWGNVDRISPEAPVPVVSVTNKEYRIGGAGNVAVNVQSLGAKPYILTVTGVDEDADNLNKLFAEHAINTGYSFKSENRITTSKTRIISRNQQMMRLDAEITDDLSLDEEVKLIDLFEIFIKREQPHIVILEDYNKGALTESVIHHIISSCKKNNILTAVDPKRKNFFSYKNVDIFKPNLREVKSALNLFLDDVDASALQNIHRELHNMVHHNISFITLSDKGLFYHGHECCGIVSSHLRNIADVSGAGDTVIAVASLIYAVTKDVRLTAEVANIAGGLVCEEVGTVAIKKDKLLQECELLLS
ncbi:MAG: carbohydrate kinase [Chitinophagaceae bacterium]|nr:carbohydrate kinase [Chitinophagaceae bacterium]